MSESETDTWYVLADGTHAHPAEVERGEDGVLKSKGGVPVALRDNGLPLTSGVATRSNKQAARAGRRAGKQPDGAAGGDAKAAETADDQKPDGQQQDGSYTTRESRAD